MEGPGEAHSIHPEAREEERCENHHRNQSMRAVGKASPTGSDQWPVLQRMRDGYWAPIPGPSPGAGEAGDLEGDGLKAGVHCMGPGHMLDDLRRRGGHIHLGEGVHTDQKVGARRGRMDGLGEGERKGRRKVERKT